MIKNSPDKPSPPVGASSTKVYFFDASGKLAKENVEGEFFLRFLYSSFWGKILRFIFRRKYVAQIYAAYQKSSFSKNKIKPFVKKHNIDLSQAEKKLEQFFSFNDFFIRKLKFGARQIDGNPNIIVAPADSKLFIIPDISDEVSFFVKNTKFNLKKFLGNEQLAQECENGTLMLFRLAPYDYHRFHFPVDCVPLKAKNINGVYESVNPLVYKSGVQPLTENERKIVLLKTEKFSDVVLVAVGAMLVGKIKLNFDPKRNYKKGQEMGYFEFGGSTIALLFKNGMIKPKQKFLGHSLQDFETAVKMGQAVT